jgi:hypothetical protein
VSIINSFRWKEEVHCAILEKITNLYVHMHVHAHEHTNDVQSHDISRDEIQEIVLDKCFDISICTYGCGKGKCHILVWHPSYDNNLGYKCLQYCIRFYFDQKIVFEQQEYTANNYLCRRIFEELCKSDDEINQDFSSSFHPFLYRMALSKLIDNFWD